ncbi:hypothetical protein [uncultured Halomonas sp.]|uniref:hypothetical protein n=1 Tax=uncultured Halomonas sp. TaxID=173971 RepID=UPI0026127A57|nr:hypothetical protein [uncultured Halomonas sp.]
MDMERDEFGVCASCGAMEGMKHMRNCEHYPKPALDVGAHYRWEIRRRITDTDIARGWVRVKLDPYRICRVAGVGGGPHEHATKKLLRGEAKGHEARELIREARACLDRWQEMLDEDEEEAACR